MQIYVVGGAVRDTLLGETVQDRDYVVVGATPEQMVTLGYKPVGKDFPVFLHPITKEEYALARTERKTAQGYHGFRFYYAPEVTLEQDLARRDLTINAMACPVYNGTQAHPHELSAKRPCAPIIDTQTLIDPFGGRADLQAGILRHVSDAFLEDPVRILRAARFAARFTTFQLAPETLTLMIEMVRSGEVDALVPERVWQEIAIGLMSPAPERLFSTLASCKALPRLIPELDGLFPPLENAPSTPNALLLALRYAAQHLYTLSMRFAVLVTAIPLSAGPSSMVMPGEQAIADTSETQIPFTDPSTAPFIALCQRLKVPNACKDLALLVHRARLALERTLEPQPDLQAADFVTLFERCDAFRKPERLYEALQVCQAHQVGRATLTNLSSLESTAQRHFFTSSSACLPKALDAARQVEAAAIAQEYAGHPQQIKQALHDARIKAIQVELNIR